MPSATVVVAVFRQAGANAVEVAKSVRDLLPSDPAAAAAVRCCIVPIYDRSQTIVNSVKDVQETLYIAFVLVVMVIFVFLGRATDTLIPAVALPLSLLLTFIVMKVLGYSLDNLSLMALTLAIGFLVDDAIVFLENTVRRMEDGTGARSRPRFNGAKEISFTILSMTISLAAVFLPLVFMSGLIGRIFREFSITIIVSIFASGHRVADADAADVRRACWAIAAKARRRPGWSASFGAVEHRVLGCVRPLALVLPAASLDLGGDLGRLPCGNRLPVLRGSQVVPAGRRQLVHPRRDGRAGRHVARSDARLSERRPRSSCRPIRRCGCTFTMSGNSSVPGREPGLPDCVPERSAQARRRLTQVAGQLMGTIMRQHPGRDGVLAAATRARDQHRARRRMRRASSRTRSPASTPTQVYGAAGKLTAKMYRVSWASCS